MRGLSGEIAVYPLNRNLHRDGILRLTRAPWRAPKLELAARRHVRRVLKHFDYVGVLAIEFFVTPRRAARQRDGAARAQLRALDHRGRGDQPVREPPAGDPRPAAGPTRATRPQRDAEPDRPDAGPGKRCSPNPALHLHDYGKSPREGRKLGHLTIVETTAAAADRRAATLLRRLESRKI